MNNHMSSGVFDEITNPFSMFNGCTVEIWDRDKYIHPTLGIGFNNLSMMG